MMDRMRPNGFGIGCIFSRARGRCSNSQCPPDLRPLPPWIPSRLHEAQSLGRHFEEFARSAYLASLPRLRTRCLATQGTLDDAMLDEIAEWLLVIEKVARPFKRFVDFSRLTTVAVRTFLSLREREGSNSRE